MSADRKKSDRPKHDVSHWEWVSAGVSLVAVLGIIVFLATRALNGPDRPPAFTFVVDSIVSSDSGYSVQFTAHNTGTVTASAVVIDAGLMRDTATIERSSITIDYIPAGSSARGAVLFTADPRTHALHIRGAGYVYP